MSTATRSKGPASKAPNEGNKGSSRDLNTASQPEAQIAMRGFTPKQNASLDKRFAQTNFVPAELMNEVRLLRQDRQ